MCASYWLYIGGQSSIFKHSLSSYWLVISQKISLTYPMKPHKTWPHSFNCIVFEAGLITSLPLFWTLQGWDRVVIWTRLGLGMMPKIRFQLPQLRSEAEQKISGWWFQPYPSEKWWSSLVGMMKFPTEWNVIKCMFQTTNQIILYHVISIIIIHH